MSRKNIAKILNTANNAAGRIAGYMCPKYRPLDYFDPVQPKNEIKPQYAAFWLSANFDKTLDYSFQIFKAILDSSDVQPGDIFVDPQAQYLVVSSREAEATYCVIVNSTIDVKRPTYADTGAGFGATTLDIATKMPVNIQAMQGIPAHNATPGRQLSQAHFIEYKIRTYFPEQLLKVGDQITTDHGNKMVIRSIEFGLLGYLLTCQEVK